MESRGIVLKSKNLGDGLRSLSLFTELLGRLNVIVKVKRGEFPLKYEPFSVTHFKLLQKGDRFEVVEGRLIKENFPKNQTELLYRSKLVKLLIPHQLSPNRKLFELLDRYLPIKRELPLAYGMFLSKLLFVEGIAPRLNRCVECGKREVWGFSPKKGGVVCKSCFREGELRWNLALSIEARKLIKEPFSKVVKSYSRKLLPQIVRAFEEHYKERTT
jgi:DNA repair protein RecO (recombination protein O)